MSGPMEKRIREKLQAEFAPLYFELENESHQHSVPKNSETHFRVFLVSALFEGLSRIERARRVHAVLASELREGVHALSHKTLTPAEWEAQGHDSKMQSPPCMGGSKPK